MCMGRIQPGISAHLASLMPSRRLCRDNEGWVTSQGKRCVARPLLYGTYGKTVESHKGRLCCEPITGPPPRYFALFHLASVYQLYVRVVRRTMGKFYAIARGFKTGIAHDEETRQILTNNYKDNSNKSFKTRLEAVEWLDKKLGVQDGDWPDIDGEDAKAARHAADIEKIIRGAESAAAIQAADVYREDERKRAIAEARLRGKRSVVAPAPGRFPQPTSSSYVPMPLLRGPVSRAAFKAELLEAIDNVCDRFGLGDAPATTKLLLPAPEPSAASRRAGTINTLFSSPQDRRNALNGSIFQRENRTSGSPMPSFLEPEDTLKGRSHQRRSPFRSMDSTTDKQSLNKPSFLRDSGRSHKSAVSEDEDEASSDPFASDSEASEESPPRSQHSQRASHLSSKPGADTSSLKSSKRRFKEPSPAFSDSITQKKRGRAESRSRTATSHSQPTPSSHREGDHSRVKRDRTTRSPPATFDMATVKKRRREVFDDLVVTASGINTPRKPSVRKASRAGSVRERPASKKAKTSPNNIKKGTSSRRRSRSDSEDYEGPISVPSDNDSLSGSERSPSPTHSKRKAHGSPGSSDRGSESEKSDSDASDNSDTSIPLKSRRSRQAKRR
ncbi:hypothetical protein FMUND_9325 [Fusarium mundagurra]|uniref:Ribonuclease H1 N-terminal domain-containing protein n=1 Tax=Fusarium mundagurra TaxID=1567541 RepID=A0A8H5YEK6_9HYPO|nr:hypothetical protein FMUND_9325 [Fusarium mundagurra]